MLGILSAQQEFLFPDTPLGPLSAQLRVVSARNGRVGVQIMFACAAECGSVSVSGGGFDASLYELVDVPVEYNTGDGVNQGGAMVILPQTCPDYAIRRAPFRLSQKASGCAENRHSRFSCAFDHSSVLSPGRHAFALAIMPQETWQ